MDAAGSFHALPLVDDGAASQNAAGGRFPILLRPMRARGATRASIGALVAAAVLLDIMALGSEPLPPPPAAALAGAYQDSPVPTVEALILSSSAMYGFFGVANTPVFATTSKGFFNFFAQMGLLMGLDIFRGTEAVRSHLKGAEWNFGLLSVAFQVLGQISAVSAYGLLAYHTACWAGREQWQRFTLLVSQHSGSTTIVVGLANNAVVSAWASGKSKTRATVLFYTGLLSGVPLWATLAYCVLSPAGLIALIALTTTLVLVTRIDSRENVEKQMRQTPTTLLAIVSCLFWAQLVFVWFLLGIMSDPWSGFMLLGAVLAELLAPLSLLFMLTFPSYFDLQDTDKGLVLTSAFGVAVACCVGVSTLVPTCLLTLDGWFAGAAPAAFAGKKIVFYFQKTLVEPVGTGESVLHLWWSELLAWLA